MTSRAAPVYLRAHDLASWILGRVEGWDPAGRALLGEPLAASARELVCALSLALTFPRGRRGQVRAADRAVVRTRVLLRLAHARGRLTARQARYAQEELLVIGRMIGAWQKRLQPRRRPHPPSPGTGPDVAPPA